MRNALMTFRTLKLFFTFRNVQFLFYAKFSCRCPSMTVNYFIWSGQVISEYGYFLLNPISALEREKLNVIATLRIILSHSVTSYLTI